MVMHLMPPKPCDECGSPEKAGCLCEVENEQCPVCGYYCLGKGGRDCIDKPGLLALLAARGDDD